jgi:hypothetical protein
VRTRRVRIFGPLDAFVQIHSFWGIESIDNQPAIWAINLLPCRIYIQIMMVLKTLKLASYFECSCFVFNLPAFF